MARDAAAEEEAEESERFPLAEPRFQPCATPSFRSRLAAGEAEGARRPAAEVAADALGSSRASAGLPAASSSAAVKTEAARKKAAEPPRFSARVPQAVVPD